MCKSTLTFESSGRWRNRLRNTAARHGNNRPEPHYVSGRQRCSTLSKMEKRSAVPARIEPIFHPAILQSLSPPSNIPTRPHQLLLRLGGMIRPSRLAEIEFPAGLENRLRPSHLNQLGSAVSSNLWRRERLTLSVWPIVPPSPPCPSVSISGCPANSAN